MSCWKIDYSNPYRQISAGVLTENAKQVFRNKTGIIVFRTGGYCMSILSFSLNIYCAAGSFEVSIEYDKKEWNIKKL